MRLIPEDTLGIVCLFQETEGESYLGKVCVAEVILRRTKRKFSSDGTVAGTVLRKYQFSGMNTDSPSRIRSFKIDTDNPIVQECVKAWEEAKAGSNYVPDCLHYFNPSISNPYWGRDAKIVKEVGNHRFVIPKEVA